MDRLVYTALSGLRSAMAAQDVTAHNIANASTIGFKRDVSAAQSRHLVGGQSFASRIQAAEGTLEADNAPGTVNQTGRALDVAMLGDSMMAVQAPVSLKQATALSSSDRADRSRCRRRTRSRSAPMAR